MNKKLFRETHPELYQLIDVEETSKVFPGTDVHSLNQWSTKKVMCHGDCGHSWETYPQRMRSRKTQCPYCGGQRVLPGFNDLATIHPEVLSEWDYSKNDIEPEEIFPKSGRKVWWICDKKHSWRVAVCDKVMHRTGCPYCAGKKVLAGYNDAASTHKEIIDSYWDFAKNSVQPTEVTAGSKKKVFWKCSEGHSWETAVQKVLGESKTRCPVCSGNKINPGVNDLHSAFPAVAAELCDDPKATHAFSNKKKNWKCSVCGFLWESTVVNRTAGGNGCPACVARSSRQEDELHVFLQSILPGEDIIRHDRTIIKPKELDFFIPSKKIAIEYNGLFWHSDAKVKTKDYHREKFQRCAEQGIQLVSIWSDDWTTKRTVVESMLSHKLGVSDKPRVFARKTRIVEVDTATARSFCDAYHIQGFCHGSAYFGLEYDGEMVALTILKKIGDTLRLERFCTSRIVVGGAGKLTSKAMSFGRSQGCTQLVTFADATVSDGGLYQQLGFTNDGEIPPDYKYIIPHDNYATRRHKFNYRKKRFETDKNLLFEPNLTEKQLAELNGFHRVFDCGKTRFVKPIEQ